MRVSHFFWVGGVLLTMGRSLSAQASNDTQRMTLAGVRIFAVHTQVQMAGQATLQRVDQALLRARIEQAVRREGIVVQGAGDVRDGSAAQISLVYLVMPIRDGAGLEAAFAASSCLHASQHVRIPRLERGGRIAYTVAPTWSSCGIVVGDTDGYGETILQNAEEQIARFLKAWRSVNAPPSPEPVTSPPQLGLRLFQP